jgi:hypothetical protein
MKTELIHPQLKTFLIENNFSLIWSKIRRTAKDEKTLARHFHDWFDSFRTLKMINYFTREVYPQINMFAALERIFILSGMSKVNFCKEETIPPLSEQMGILRYMRMIT